MFCRLSEQTHTQNGYMDEEAKKVEQSQQRMLTTIFPHVAM
jgi:hypothetical protein